MTDEAAGPFLYSFIALFEARTNPLLNDKHYTTSPKSRAAIFSVPFRPGPT